MLDELLRAVFTDYGSLGRIDAQLAGGIDHELWGVLEEAGLTLVSVPEGVGGAGGELRQSVAVARAAGEYAAPVPVAETDLLAGWLLAAAGRKVPSGPLTAVEAELDVDEGPSGVRLGGAISRVPWARSAAYVVLLVPHATGGRVVMLPPSQLAVVPSVNLAGEPRDHVTVDHVVEVTEVADVTAAVVEEFRLRAAGIRVLGLAGAARRALDVTVRYTAEREQFGRPLARFQAVQQQLAELAAEVAAMEAAANALVATAERAGFLTAASRTAVAAAKARTGAGAGVVARIAHQLHGALGFTREHALRLSTTRLWAWRDDYGNEQLWRTTLAKQALHDGDAWRLVTRD